MLLPEPEAAALLSGYGLVCPTCRQGLAGWWSFPFRCGVSASPGRSLRPRASRPGASCELTLSRPGSGWVGL